MSSTLLSANTLKLRPAFLRTFGKRWLHKKLQSRLAAHPRLYLACLTPLALLGYLFLLFFPLSSVVLIGQIASSWSVQSSLNLPTETLIQLLAGIAAICFSLPVFHLRFKIPSAYQLDSSDIPTLEKTINKLCQIYRIRHFSKILFDENLDIQVINASKLAWPFSRKRTLIIGLPILLCYSPTQVYILLARRIGQASGRDHIMLLWLNTLNKTWLQYTEALTRMSILALPLARVFKFYSQLLQSCSLYANQLQELAADRYALEVANDQDMVELFSQTIITENFLQQKYWPKIDQLAQRKPCPGYLPYANMSKVIRNGLMPEYIKTWIQTALRDPTPSLQQASLLNRLHNIGHEKVRPPQRLQKTAATHYLSKAILTQTIAEFDQRWLNSQQGSTKKPATSVIKKHK